MPTTSNFGWTTPADTDLVKDGAAAIRTLGNGVDTSFVDLKGGTTGQVLAKASGSDLDFSWVTTDDANAIQNAIVDAKGDLIAASAADTPARLAVGSNGETLVADSSATTGLRWQGSNAAGRNIVLNSDANIWQRGTSIAAVTAAAGTGYTADRWQAYKDGITTATVSRQSASLDQLDYAIRLQRDSGNTGLSRIYLAQPIEDVQCNPIRGKTVVLSFWARKGANYSSASDSLTVKLKYKTSSGNAFINPTGDVISTSVTLTSSFQRFSVTGTVLNTYIALAPEFSFVGVGTAGANDWFEITGIQLEAGSVATPFTTATGTLAGELAACQRYYYRLGNDNTAVNRSICSGAAYASNDASGVVQFPTTMRTTPTLDATSGTNYYGFLANSATDGFNSFTLGYADRTSAIIYNSSQIAQTAGHGGVFITQNASASVAFSSEL